MCICVRVCAHAYICVCVSVCKSTYVCIYVVPKANIRLSFSIILYLFLLLLLSACLFLRQGLSFLPGAHWFVWPACHWAPGIHLFLLLRGHNYEFMLPHPFAFMWFLGSNSGLQALTESTFYPPSYLPSPHWEGSLQMLIGGKRNLTGGKKAFLDKIQLYGFSTNTAIMTCVRKK